jgi:RNA polymerase sigma-70 factor (ECF subfamily)
VGTDARDDAQLVAEAQRGSREAAGELFSRHWRDAWRTAHAITGGAASAEDVVQDAFERAFRALSRFDGRRPFGAWLYRIVVNRALTLLRDERRLVSLETIEEPVAERDQDLAPDRGLLAAVAALPAERRVVVILRYGLGHSVREIAELVDLPVGTVQSRLARALTDLRARLEVRDAERS